MATQRASFKKYRALQDIVVGDPAMGKGLSRQQMIKIGSVVELNPTHYATGALLQNGVLVDIEAKPQAALPSGDS